MKRKFSKKLMEWKNNGMKKPLMVVGARQIGKTYLIKKFISENFKNYLYLDLEKEEDIKNIFERTIDPEIVIKEIELQLNKKIDIENTILFFDEVQTSERFIVSLKYFNESNINYKIICAGSLLGVKINRFSESFPVGKVDIEYMYPMDFEEFLIATNNELLRDRINECYKNLTPMSDNLHEKAMNLYREYLCIGGMPEAISNFIENDMDILRYNNYIISNITEAYIADMKKYVINSSEAIKIENVYRAIPSQLAKNNKNFKYNLVEENGRKRKYESALDWLISSKMVLISHKVNRVEIPLKVYENVDAFKLYLSDVGILTNLCEINYSDILTDKNFIYKGAITENYIATELRNKNYTLYYWTSNRDAKVSFLIDTIKDGIIPIEVKSGKNVKSTSLNLYMSYYSPNFAYRFSTKNFGYENNIKSIPLYAIFCLETK